MDHAATHITNRREVPGQGLGTRVTACAWYWVWNPRQEPAPFWGALALGVQEQGKMVPWQVSITRCSVTSAWEVRRSRSFLTVLSWCGLLTYFLLWWQVAHQTVLQAGSSHSLYFYHGAFLETILKGPYFPIGPLLGFEGLFLPRVMSRIRNNHWYVTKAKAQIQTHLKLVEMSTEKSAEFRGWKEHLGSNLPVPQRRSRSRGRVSGGPAAVGPLASL